MHLLTMGTKPTKRAKDNDEGAKLKILHIDENGGGDCIHPADDHHLEENLRKIINEFKWMEEGTFFWE